MTAPASSPTLFIGLMSGTSLDGVDGVLVDFSHADGRLQVDVLASAHQDFLPDLKAALLALQASAANEIEQEAVSANRLAHCYTQCVRQLLQDANCRPASVAAIGAHGQTIRHRPECGYTRQVNNGALLAELTGIDVVADFRSRDIAAGGQGAPLVPAFHHALFADPNEIRVIANIGGMSNISVLDTHDKSSLQVTGFDTGPGNVLLDAWIAQNQGLPFDAAGSWAASGVVNTALLAALLDEPFFRLPPPKSTGRDVFNPDWLKNKLALFDPIAPANVQATLTELTATTLVAATLQYAPQATAVYLCGGGAFNQYLMSRIASLVHASGSTAHVQSTTALGVSPDLVEAIAFAWLTWRFTERQSGNLPGVTGAIGPRILGALYPA